MDVKVGDMVHVRGAVREVGRADKSVIAVDFPFPNGDSDIQYVRMSDVVHVEPRPLAVGDKVQTRHGYFRNDAATLLGLDDGVAWIKFDGSMGKVTHIQVAACDLVRA